MASIERPNDPASRAFRRFREHGDPAAMTEVFDLVGQELFALAAHIARDAAEAEDLVQEVFLAALAGARRFDPTRAVTPWLVGILVKEAQKARRGRARREESRAERAGPRTLHDAGEETQRAAPHTDAPLAKALTGEVRLAITLALEGVPARYREVLRPVLEDGVAPTKLAATLGRAPGTVRMQLYRGLELLRKALPHTLAPALVPPLVSTLALELGAGRGLATIRAELARRASIEGPGLALAGAAVLVSPSLPLLGVVVMQTKVLAAVAATALAGIALLVLLNDRAESTLEATPMLVAPTDTSLVARSSAVPGATPAPGPIERSAVPTREPDAVTLSDDISATATLAVHVVDETGAAVPKAWVTLQSSDAELEAARREKVSLSSTVVGVEATGWGTLHVPAGRPLELRSATFGDDVSPETVHVEALEPGAHAEALIRVRRKPDIEVQGRVIDSATGAPLGDVSVHLSQQRGHFPPFVSLPPRTVPTATTDKNGEFRAPARTWVSTTALFTCPGWSPQLAGLKQLGGAVAEVALRPGARIQGTVSGGRAGLVVRATLPWRELLRGDRGEIESFDGLGADFELTAIVDAHGEFVLDDVPAGAPLKLSLTEEERQTLLLQEPWPVWVDAGATHQVAWTLGAGGRIVCTVREADGEPGTNEELWLVPASVAIMGASYGASQLRWNPTQRKYTDEGGAAVFEDVLPGQWIVALAPDPDDRYSPGDAARYYVPATIESSGVEVPVELTLHRDLWIRGRVVAPDGSLVPSAIGAFALHYVAYLQAREFENGAFKLGPLVPGRYSLSASGPGPDYDGAPLMGSESVEVEAGARDVELRLRPAAAFVLSATDSATGVAVPAGFKLVGNGVQTAGNSRPSDPRWRYSCPPGTYVALAFTTDGRAGLAVVATELGEWREVSLPVSPGGSLRLRHTGPIGKLSCRIEHAGAHVASHDVERGRDTLVALPAGPFDLHLSIVDDTAGECPMTLREEVRRVDVTAGVELEIDLGP